MAAFMVCLFVLFAMAGHSNAAYCICKDGVSDQALQKNIDYACGAGADCTPILQNGACFNPNTVKDHCNWAVNSYYQKKGQASGSCDFLGTAVTSANPPSQSSTCVYPSTASNTGTVNTTSPPSSQTPGTGTGSGVGTPTTTIPGTGTGTSTSGGFGLPPTTGTGGLGTDSSAGLKTLQNLFFSICSSLLLSGLMYTRV